MQHTSLNTFIAHARSKGMDHGTIRMLLLSAGWKERDIALALSEQGLDLPVPLPADAGSARDAFFHLLNFAALYTVIISMIVLFFDYINRWFPDAVTDTSYYYDDNASTVRWFMSAVIVAFPIFIWMSRMIQADFVRQPEKAAGGVRRWLTYITLFVAATTMMGDVIALVFSLLEGEITVRFLLKVLVIFAFAGTAFLYYFMALKISPDDPVMRKRNRFFVMLTTVTVAIALIVGGIIIGSPGQQRQKRFDDRRIEDLRGIHSEVRNIVYDGKPMDADTAPSLSIPGSLQEVADNAVYQAPSIVDPETLAPYELVNKTDTTYDLCATFTFPRDDKYDIFWNHPAGRHCFELDVTDTIW